VSSDRHSDHCFLYHFRHGRRSCHVAARGSLIAPHLFVFYYAVLADLTPPDAVTAFAAANLSGSEPMGTGVEAFRLGIAGWLVPFAFVYQPALLLNGSTLSIVISFAVTAVGVLFLAGGVIGHVAGRLSPLQRCSCSRPQAFLCSRP